MQPAHDGDRVIDAAVVQHDVMIDHRRVMAQETLDDVVLVENPGNGDDAHPLPAPVADAGSTRALAQRILPPTGLTMKGRQRMDAVTETARWQRRPPRLDLG